MNTNSEWRFARQQHNPHPRPSQPVNLPLSDPLKYKYHIFARKPLPKGGGTREVKASHVWSPEKPAAVKVGIVNHIAKEPI